MSRRLAYTPVKKPVEHRVDRVEEEVAMRWIREERRSVARALGAIACAAVALTGAIGVLAAPRGDAGAARTPAFESHWQDGKAELASYRYRVTRYGEPRTGEAVMITVTEPFRASKRVKADDPSANPADTFEALKMNLVRDFRTGIYDYDTMVSAFCRSRDFSPVKISFTAAEWCGHVYEEIAFEPNRTTDFVRSYFEDESTSRSLQRKKGGVAEDLLFVLLRGLRGDFLKPGETRTIHFLPSPFTSRLTHRPVAWTTATAERAPAPERVRVPAGSFEADLMTVRVADGREGRFWIERAYPHRVLKWVWTPPPKATTRMGSDGADSGELMGSKRLPYWQLHGNGDERHLRELGLGG